MFLLLLLLLYVNWKYYAFNLIFRIFLLTRCLWLVWFLFCFYFVWFFVMFNSSSVIHGWFFFRVSCLRIILSYFLMYLSFFCSLPQKFASTLMVFHSSSYVFILLYLFLREYAHYNVASCSIQFYANSSMSSIQTHHC